MNWREFFEGYRLIDIASDKDLLFQVGATVGGQPISKQQFDQTIRDAESALRLSNDDRLLDLCCGNGVITHALGPKVKSVVGVDFSKPYIGNAQKYKSAINIEYHCGDVCDLRSLAAISGAKFTKVLIHSALAYFTREQCFGLLSNLNGFITDDARIFIAAVPDAGRKWRFYNTPGRALRYLWGACLGRESGIGKWWMKSELEDVCRKVGLQCCFSDPHPILHVAHYRFDVIITKARGSGQQNPQ